MCTSIAWSKETNGQTTPVARNVDWLAPMGTNLWVPPAGPARVGSSAGNPLKWSSKLGSVVASSCDSSGGVAVIALLDGKTVVT